MSRVKDTSNNTLATYKWLADGRKASAVNGDNTFGLEYLGSLVYKKNGGTLELESTAFGGGRINKASNDYEVNYFLTDHLGSTRAVFNAASGEVAERNNYHSFGQRWDTGGSAITPNRYRFSGKEEQGVFGLPYSDFGVRMYDPATGRWIVVDPLARKYYRISPYAYVGNNPIRRIDPDGRTWVDLIGNPMWENGNFTNYATPAFKRGTAAMRATETGREAFENVANMSANIGYIISPGTKYKTENEVTTLVKGSFVPGEGQSVNENGGVDGTIIIYEGSVG